MNDFLCSLMILEYWRWYLHWRYSVNHSRWMGNSVQPGNCFHLNHCWFAAAIQINNHLRTGLMNEYSLQFLSQLIKIFNLTLNTTETKKGGDIHISGIFIMFLSTWPKWSLLIILHLYGYIIHIKRVFVVLMTEMFIAEFPSLAWNVFFYVAFSWWLGLCKW